MNRTVSAVYEHVSRKLGKTCRIINFHLCKCCVSVLFLLLSLSLSFYSPCTVSFCPVLRSFSPVFPFLVTSPLASVERIVALTQRELLNGLFAGTPKVNTVRFQYATNCDKQTSRCKWQRKIFSLFLLPPLPPPAHLSAILLLCLCNFSNRHSACYCAAGARLCVSCLWIY